MLAGMTSAQYSELLAYDSLEPIGDERADFRMGMIASTIANYMSMLAATVIRANGGKVTEPKQTKPLDFMPFSQPEPEPQTPEQKAAIMKIAAAIGE